VLHRSAESAASGSHRQLLVGQMSAALHRSAARAMRAKDLASDTDSFPSDIASVPRGVVNRAGMDWIEDGLD
jgi:hypothetical protein